MAGKARASWTLLPVSVMSGWYPARGKEAPKVLPWVHTLIANIKGNIRGIHHGVSPKHLPRYLAEFCYRFNRRFWEPQMFNRMLHACLNSTTITFSELRA